jgi:adenosylhomocysteine nucleosidase
VRADGGSAIGMQTESSTSSPRFKAVGALVGIVAALPREARCLSEHRGPAGSPHAIGPGVLLVISGIGPVAARAASEALVAAGAGALVSWGVAAGLGSAAPGALVLADRVVELPDPKQSGDGDSVVIPANASWTDRLAGRLPLPFLRGSIAGVSRVLSTPAEKREVASSGALAADMETAAIARVAQQAGIPWIAIRAVSDGVDHALPRSVIRAINGTGDVQLGRLAAGLAHHPADALELPRIARGFNAALRTLREVAAVAGPTLLAPNSRDVAAVHDSTGKPVAEVKR